MNNRFISRLFKSIKNKMPVLMVGLKKSVKKIKLILKIAGRILWNFLPLVVFEFRHSKKFRLRVVYGITGIILFLIIIQMPRWYKQFNFRTHFISEQTDLAAVSEETAQKSINGKCDDVRKSAEKTYDVSEISDAVANSNGEKITLIGKEKTDGENEESEDKDAISLDITGKNVEMFCFNFKERIVVHGDGNIDIGLDNFKDISGNALVVSDGKGKIHQNIIENSEKSGIFADSGQWDIYGNIIKNNLSYGVYGGYGADLKFKENFISGNGGYQVRLLGKREVYTGNETTQAKTPNIQGNPGVQSVLQNK